MELQHGRCLKTVKSIYSDIHNHPDHNKASARCLKGAVKQFALSQLARKVVALDVLEMLEYLNKFLD